MPLICSSKRRRIRLCSWGSKAKGGFCSCVVWGWSLYNIVESESDPLTRRPVDLLTFLKKNPSRANGRSTYIQPPSLAKIRQRTSEEIGNTQTNKQTNKRCSNYSMMVHYVKLLSSWMYRVWELFQFEMFTVVAWHLYYFALLVHHKKHCVSILNDVQTQCTLYMGSNYGIYYL